MRRNAISKVAIAILMVCVLSALIILPMGCGDEPAEKIVLKEKAIIILPGIMGSNIIDTTNGNPLWAPLEKGLKMWELNFPADLGTIMSQPAVEKLLDFDGKGGAYEWLHKMKVNPDGTVNNENSAQVIMDNGKPKYTKCSTYGTLEYYEKAYNYLHDNFKDEYDVRMFEYDWRLDNSVSAERLEKFINDRKYKEVILVGHSMGGVLASTYLARSPENRTKVTKFFSLGAPFFGAHKALRVIENPLSMIGDSKDMAGMLDTVKGAVDGLNGEGAFDRFFSEFMDFAYNLPTIYQLIPYADMCNGYKKWSGLRGEGIIRVDGNEIKNYDEFMEFARTRGFVNKRCLDNMIKWQDEQYFMNNGVKTHASMGVNTYYFVGNNLDTEVCVNFENGEMTGCTMSPLGDGTVPLYSATCGLDLDDSKVYEFDKVSHGNLVYDDICLEKMAELIRA